MPTTFNVFSLGTFASIDPTEGNTTAENASILVGQTIGGFGGNALAGNIQSFSPGSSGFGGGTSTVYDMNNAASNDTFRINGGPNQTFDGTSIYNATITYLDGSTATITAVVFQDTVGNTYLAPEFSSNADQAALEAGPLLSVTFDSLVGNSYSGLTGSRESGAYVACFTPGVRILSERGQRPVETLAVGDRVVTRDRGAQAIRWIGRAERVATGNMAPIRIARGALGRDLPERDLVVSQQHRMLVRSRIAERMTGAEEVLIPAKKLLALPGVDIVEGMGDVTYIHILLDRHEIIYAEGAPTESLLVGKMARQCIDPEALAELMDLFPEIVGAAPVPARPIPEGAKMRSLVARHLKNDKPLIAA
ncbi:Hint domain-containing protein [Hasllibacter sp. MH4015]|uniref:Hint domain-containing protein n=1 Tax=Hasllibacter sp. MH4015 TaxID=2854029 RepID=UPI001CD70FB3|nr:Hint domain-containing protein [Hasllibacter sp. MH4015]